jgi:hypothetical protein
MAAYAVLATNARSVGAEARRAGCGALPRPLDEALARAAKAPTALDASLELDLGYAAALALALAGHVPSSTVAAKRIDVAESAHYGEDCKDVFALARRLTGTDGEPAARVGTLALELSRSDRCPAVRKLLTDVPSENVAHVIDSLVLDEPETDGVSKSPVDRCPELPAVIDRITNAINLGAPLYNKGDHQGCHKLYERTAKTLATEVIPPGRCPLVRVELAGAMREAGRAGEPGEAAWALRRAFDRITGSHKD